MQESEDSLPQAVRTKFASVSEAVQGSHRATLILADARRIPTVRVAYGSTVVREPWVRAFDARDVVDAEIEPCFYFGYQLAGSGWADAVLADKNTEARMTSVSDLTDALGDLLSGVRALMERQTRVVVSWESEPGEYRWILEATGKDVSARILTFKDAYDHEPDHRGATLFETPVPLRTFVVTIASGAESVLAEHGTKGYRAKWAQHAFPEETLNAIKRLLRHETLE